MRLDELNSDIIIYKYKIAIAACVEPTYAAVQQTDYNRDNH